MTSRAKQVRRRRSRVSVRRARSLPSLLSPILLSTLLAIVCSAPSAGAARVDHEAECTYKRLTWDDFRGPVMNGQQQAWIAAQIVMEPVLVEMMESEGGGAVARARNPIVYALMNKLESGARPGARDDRNLSHEQIHFDLTEYLARRLSRELRELEVKGDARSESLQRAFLLAVERRYSETVGELQRLQGEYDGETVHGIRAGAQKKWLDKAAKMLASEAPYELR